jgi:hypothetical protein
MIGNLGGAFNNIYAQQCVYQNEFVALHGFSHYKYLKTTAPYLLFGDFLDSFQKYCFSLKLIRLVCLKDCTEE